MIRMSKDKRTFTRKELNKILGDAKNHTLHQTDKNNCVLDGKPIIISDFDKRPDGSNSERFRKLKENSWGVSTNNQGLSTGAETPKTPKEAKKGFDKAVKEAKKESDSLKSDSRLPSRF